MTEQPKIEIWDQIEVNVKDLKDFERNPRINTKEDYARLKASIVKFGYFTPIKATQDLRIMGGHLRRRVLTELGVKRIPIMVPKRQLTDDEFYEIVVRDNVSNGGWNFDMMGADCDVEKLIDWGIPANMLGVEKTEPEDEKDDVPEPPADPVSKLGDVWILGNHRIMCGDSTKADDVARLLGDVKPHLMVTDPPYGVEYDASWREKAGVNGKKGAKGKVLNDDKADWREAWALFPGNIAYVWHADRFSPSVAESLEINGFKMRNLIIWAKNQLVIGRGDYHHQHEPCWYAVKGTGNWTGDRKQTNLWQIDKPKKSETGHSTQKPVECMRRPMENNSSPGQAVYEPFSGSGTSIIAAEQIGRHCFAMELNPAYVDVAVKRWENFTNQKAVLEQLPEK